MVTGDFSSRRVRTISTEIAPFGMGVFWVNRFWTVSVRCPMVCPPFPVKVRVMTAGAEFLSRTRLA